MALWKARGRGSLNKNLELDHGIVEGKGGKFKQKFRI